MLNLLFQEPLLFLGWILAILIALTVHEFAHAGMALFLGDNTAKYQGRLTLNPLSHLDPLGFIALLLVGFGWGKPVPFNPYNLKYQRWGPALVSLAGPLSNLFSVIVFGFFLKFLIVFSLLPPANLLIQFLNFLILINLILMVFNLIPIPPLDGSKILFALLSSPRYDHFKYVLESRGPFFLIILIILDSILPFSILNLLFQSAIGLVYKFLS